MVGQIFRMCANSLKDSKNVLGYYFRRMKSKGGHLQAIVATVHKIATIFYTMVKTKQNFDETKSGINEYELLKRKIEYAQRRLDKLNVKLKNSV